MKRDIYKDLEKWKHSTRRKPLIINGARQVGKTHALKTFGKESYQKVAYLNFEKEEKLSGYFEETLDPKKLIQVIEIHTGVDIEKGNTLIIFDEVQECPRALNSLKYFCEEANDYHIACAGSLLGVKISREKGFPVGKVNFLTMRPLTFFEFLSAVGQEKKRTHLERLTHCEPLLLPLHNSLLDLLRLYFFIGGMPEAVAEYRKSENLKVVREVQHEILDAYEKDFAKHAPPEQVMKITTVWKQIHSQLAKENKKFIFAAIRKSARGRDYEEAIRWLLDAGLIYVSTQIKTPKFPLSAYAENNIFKLFLVDVGLLAAQSNLSSQMILEGDALFTEFKGAFTENYIAQELVASRSQQLYYWASQGVAEVDFLLDDQSQITPLEVKSGTSTRAKSLAVYQDRYQPSKVLRASTLNLKKQDSLLNVPLYLISRIVFYSLEFLN